MNAPPLLPQPVSYLPRPEVQANNVYPATTRSTHHWGGAYSASGYHNYGHYPGAGQSGFVYGNRPVTYPMASGSNNYGVQTANNYPWDPYSTLDAPVMPALPFRPAPAAAPFQRRSRSPPQNQTQDHRRRSPPDLNPIAPAFAPGASAHQAFHNHYVPASNHNLAVLDGVVGRRGAWNFDDMNRGAAPYNTRRSEARVLAGHRGRFGAGSDDVRNHVASASHTSPAATNEGEDEESDDEHEEESDEVVAEEEEDEDDGDDEDNQDQNSSVPTTSTAPVHHKRPGKFHKGNYRLSCDECRRKHIKCVRPNPNRSCVGCLKAHGGPKVCKITET